MDAAANLVALGKKVGVLDRSGAWADPDPDSQRFPIALHLAAPGICLSHRSPGYGG